jgi:hypothetical protein
MKLTFIYNESIYAANVASVMRGMGPASPEGGNVIEENIMATDGNFWKYGLALGAGVAIGAAGAVLLSRGTIDLKKTAAAIMSRGMDLKEQAASIMENAKENFEDIAAEAKHEQAKRRSEKA